MIAAWIRMPLEASGYSNVRVSSGGITLLQDNDLLRKRAPRYVKRHVAPRDRVLACDCMKPPEEMLWLFWDVEVAQLDVEEHADYILSRVLERGRIDDVCWLLRFYGEQRIHRFLRERPRFELSARTLAFWRAFFREEHPWPTPPDWRRTSSVPWHG